MIISPADSLDFYRIAPFRFLSLSLSQSLSLLAQCCFRKPFTGMHHYKFLAELPDREFSSSCPSSSSWYP